MNNSKIKKLLQVIESGKYDYSEIDFFQPKYPEYEALNASINMPEVWDFLVSRLGRAPTQKEFIVEGMARSARFFLDPTKLNYKRERWLKIWIDGEHKWHNFLWTQKLRQAITARLARSYYSMTAEYTTRLMLEDLYAEANPIFIDDHRLDLILGSDITMIIDGKVRYIHVFRNSSYGRDYFYTKGKYDGYFYHKNERIIFKRDFNKESHVEVRYDLNEGTLNYIRGNMIFPNPYYLKYHVEQASGEDIEGSQLINLHNLLIENEQVGLRGIE